jgi:hypothetical protein
VLAGVGDKLYIQGCLKPFLSIGDTLLVALDGTDSFSSKKISCPCCTQQTLKNGKTLYSHTVITPVIVAPGQSRVIPLPPEFVGAQDGADKQDCKWTLLFVCKSDSHALLYEWVADFTCTAHVQTFEKSRWNGKQRLTECYRYLNQVPLRNSEDALMVNWCEVTITNAIQQVVYRNAWATSYAIDAQNIVQIVAAGRACWKVKNENNNVLKNHGYHFDHNFAHGKQL